jgi:hypothetical protein
VIQHPTSAVRSLTGLQIWANTCSHVAREITRQAMAVTAMRGRRLDATHVHGTMEGVADILAASPAEVSPFLKLFNPTSAYSTHEMN